ncbi:MAG: YIP1 family protein [Anaerolineales bacterium]|nr:YIP1 family protein [Anaerolineales bacterium]
MIQRILGVLKLDVPTFEAIEADTSATSQAAIIVAIVSLLSGIGSGISASIQNTNFIVAFFMSLIWAFVGWALWSWVTWFVGTKLFNGRATVDEMLRVIGFAYSPQFLSIIPCVGGVIGGIWSLVAGFIAIRQGLDLDNAKALFTILIGFVIYVIGQMIIGLLMGGVSGLFA